MKKIEPCPFCGGDSELREIDGYNYVDCLNCHAFMGLDSRKLSKEYLSIMWNHRTLKIISQN